MHATRVAELEVKYPTPTPIFPQFPTPTIQNFRLRLGPLQNFRLPTPTPQHEGNEILLLTSMEIVVHSKKSLFQQKFQKKLYHFKRNSQWKNDAVGHPELESDKKIRLQVLLGIRLLTTLQPCTQPT